MTDMNERVIGGQVAAVQRALSPFLELVMPPRPVTAQPVIANFAAGNPQEPTLSGFVEALRRYSVPMSIDWFAYRFMHEPARQAAAISMTDELGIGFTAEDIFLTRGASGAIALALGALIEPGDEVIFLGAPVVFLRGNDPRQRRYTGPGPVGTSGLRS
jgi:DNA-binding transcriptional MocR family regulator